MTTNIWLQFFKTDRLLNIKIIFLGIILLSICSLGYVTHQQRKQICSLKQFLMAKTSYVKSVAHQPKACKLTGIGNDEKKAFAIIDNEIFWVNDKFGDYIIQNIQLNRVILLNIKTNEKIEIPLYKEENFIELSKK